MQQSGFNPNSAARVLQDHRVTNVAAAPVWYRGLRANLEIAPGWLPALQRASSAGEPLNPSISEWFQTSTANAVPIRDHYGQTESGMIAINHWHPDVATTRLPAGSMGSSMVGFSATVLSQPTNEAGTSSTNALVQVPAGVPGSLAIE